MGENIFRNKKFESKLAKMAKRAKFEFKKELFNEMRDDLKCKTCDSMPRPDTKLWFCQNGHAICNNCYGGSKRCCAGGVSPSEVVQKLLKDLPIQCAWNGNGCNDVLTKDTLLQHEKNCVYRKINCPRIHCKDNVCFFNLMNHFDKKHVKHVLTTLLP